MWLRNGEKVGKNIYIRDERDEISEGLAKMKREKGGKRENAIEEDRK